MAELKYWIWLAQRHGIKLHALHELLNHFGGSPEAIYFARWEELREVVRGDIGPLLDKDLTEARKILSDVDEAGASVLTLTDSAYPTRLRNIYDPPIVLYVKGKLPAVDEVPSIAIVGTRKCTEHGLLIAESFGYELAQGGGLVVSGLAAGIDSAGAKGALRGGGRVVGVLGCGIDIVYPTFNGPLFDDVAAVGAIVSEYPPGTRPEKGNFPARNRIISGLSLGVMVVEAPKRSGALITASMALEQGRDVYAVPGNIDEPACEGSNALLLEGALAALSGEDILAEYDFLFASRTDASGKRERVALDSEMADQLVEEQLTEAASRRKTSKKAIDKTQDEDYILISCAGLDETQFKILSAMDGRLHVDDVISRTGLPANEVLSALTVLEIEGAVTQEPGKYFTPHFRIVD